MKKDMIYSSKGMIGSTGISLKGTVGRMTSLKEIYLR